MTPEQYAACERLVDRRTFVGRTSLGLGAMALAGLMQRNVGAVRVQQQSSTAEPGRESRGLVDPLHFAPKAKRVIFLCMAGGPSQFETFDEKPKLAELHGQPMPESYTKGQPIAQLQGSALLALRPLAKFQRHGQSGQQISELLPQIGEIADDICIIRSMQTEQINHDPAQTFLNAGTSVSGRPSMGAWINYGLGSETDDLPGFIVMKSLADSRPPQPISSRQWHSGFLPSRFQGVPVYSQNDPVHFVTNPPGVDRQRQLDVIETVNGLNRIRDIDEQNPEIAARIAQYELAFRMQASVPGLVNISDEPQHVLDMYGVKGADGSFAYNCLLARRMAERGVRFIQLYHRGWDHHNGISKYISEACLSSDQPSAALIADLKQRGMLEDTLVVWGGEFGRTPMAQGDVDGDAVGRDHHIRGFSMWLAGGGIRPGITFGTTDELGYYAAENPVHIHDLHATMMRLLGIDHERLTYRYQGRDFRLTDVAGHVVDGILA
ncbi:MAG: DUF1501 domain-containing protein [Planctomycetaceae bacterium]|nr:DUF1501 domain-containing protein [Planctomycetaceae bacterium]